LFGLGIEGEGDEKRERGEDKEAGRDGAREQGREWERGEGGGGGDRERSRGRKRGYMVYILA
jgi:hypothetical protein